MLTSDITNKAIDILRERGWNQGSFMDLDGQVCYLGALGIAAYGNPAWLPGTADLRDQAQRDLDALNAIWCEMRGAFSTPHQLAYPIGMWNDEAADVDEVIQDLKLLGEELDLRAERAAKEGKPL